MTPQLWTRNLEWFEWRQMHPDLEDREAEYLYQIEQRMFQNYQDEIINQTLNRQAKLVGDLMNLSADISTILNEGGKPFKKLTANYVGFRGQFVTNPPEGVGAFVGTGIYQFRIGDLFSIDVTIGGEGADGIYRVLKNVNQQQYADPSIAYLYFAAGRFNRSWEIVADLSGRPI